MFRSEPGQGDAVLCSGGLDSVVLLADVVRRASGGRVLPLYVSVGLAWERDERAVLERVLADSRISRRPAARDSSLRHARRLSAEPLGDQRRSARIRHT